MTAPLTYSMEAAASRLGGPFTVDFLKGHLHEIPHLKVGNGRGRAGRIAFSEQHLIQIVDKFSVAPAEAGPAPEFPSMVSARGPRRAGRAAHSATQTAAASTSTGEKPTPQHQTTRS
jgi:hypothetical protein